MQNSQGHSTLTRTLYLPPFLQGLSTWLEGSMGVQLEPIPPSGPQPFVLWASTVQVYEVQLCAPPPAQKGAQQRKGAMGDGRTWRTAGEPLC